MCGPGWHGTTICAVQKGGRVAVAGDGQVSLGQTVIKGTARKVRRLSPGGFDVAVRLTGKDLDRLGDQPGNLCPALPALA